MNLLDGVTSASCKVSTEATKLSTQVRDLSLPLLDRIEYFEDITNLEVGDTSILRAKFIERETGIRQIYLKFEGDNPTGTQKDRIAFAQVHDALRRGFDTIAIATCGNYGVAVSLAAQLAGLKCMVYIPESFHTERVKEMLRLNAKVIRFQGDYEETVKQSSNEAKVFEWYDANPGGENTPLQIRAYSEISYEIYDTLRDAPKIVAVPVSNGTLLAGVYRGFVSLYKRGRTSRIPKIIAASSAHKNPIISSVIKGLNYCEDLSPEKIKETKINEPLINWHSFDGEEAVYAVNQSHGTAFHISDKKMIKMSQILEKNEGLKILPASTAGLVSLLKYCEQAELEPDRFVAILTARD